MQDNTGTLEVKGALTRLGRQRVAEGNLNISKFAVSSDGVNYNLASENLVDPFIAIKRTPLFDVWKDGSSIQYKLIPRQRIPNYDPEFRYPFNVQNTTTLSKVSFLGQETPQDFPTHVNENGRKEIIFYGTTQNELNRIQTVNFQLKTNEVPFLNNEYSFVTVILHDLKYFDIGLTQGQRNLFGTDNLPSLEARNNANNASLGTSETSDFPKYLTMAVRRATGTTPNYTNFSFDLRYRGNYRYKYPQVNRYETLLTIFSEETGHMEHIRLIISPELPKN